MDLQTLETHWKYPAALLAIGLAFAAGRFSAPTKVQTHDETKKTQQATVVQAAATQHVDAKAETKERIVYRDRTIIKYPDGKVEQRDITRTDNADKVADKVTSAQETVHAETHLESVDKVADKIVTHDAPRFQVNALVGTDPSLDLLYGAQIQYRILGPIWGGAWFLKGPQVEGGLSIGLQF